MMGLIGLEVYYFVSNITAQNNKFELYTDTFDEFSFEEIKDELGEILYTSEITSLALQHEITIPRNIQAHIELRLEESNSDGHIIFLMGYARSAFRDSECYLRIVVSIG